MAISHRPVEMMGGRIEVESDPGEGSMFRFTLDLPVSATEPGESGRESGDAVVSREEVAGMRVLVRGGQRDESPDCRRASRKARNRG
jgi:hypothetical protein